MKTRQELHVVNQSLFVTEWLIMDLFPYPKKRINSEITSGIEAHYKEAGIPERHLFKNVPDRR